MTYELREATSAAARRSLSDKSSPGATMDSRNEIVLAPTTTALHVRTGLYSLLPNY